MIVKLDLWRLDLRRGFEEMGLISACRDGPDLPETVSFIYLKGIQTIFELPKMRYPLKHDS